MTTRRPRPVGQSRIRPPRGGAPRGLPRRALGVRAHPRPRRRRELHARDRADAEPLLFRSSSAPSVDRPCRRRCVRRGRRRAPAVPSPVRRDRLDLLPHDRRAVRRAGGADRAVRAERRAVLFRFRRNLDRAGRPAAVRTGGGGLGAGAARLRNSGRSGRGLGRSGSSRASRLALPGCRNTAPRSPFSGSWRSSRSRPASAAGSPIPPLMSPRRSRS